MPECFYGDPTCPCQDGDYCNYEDDPTTRTEAMEPPQEWLDAHVELVRRDALTMDEAKGLIWAACRGLHELKNDGFPNAEPAVSNIPILKAAIAKLEAKVNG